ncbi:MAG: amidohydrolase 2 [Verrucomicrobia bacterium]|nr:amidohydrolase 2 [Verrucomicrobiota bacterium]
MTDAHVHLYPPEADADPAAWAAARREPHWARLCTRRRKDGRPVQTLPTLGALLQEMDSAGVERAWLLGWYWERPETCAEQNRLYAECIRAHPDRLSAFATIHPSAGITATLDEIRRAHGEGLRGLGELSPHSQAYPVDDPVFQAALDLAEELNLPVNLHVTDPDSARYPGWVATPPDDFLKLARSHSRVRFILAHWGGLLPLRNPAALALPNVWYDTAASPLLYDEGIWRRFLDQVPADRVVFGSDYPLNVYPRIDSLPGMARFVAEVHRAGLTADELAAVVRDNAKKILPPTARVTGR